MSTPPSTGTSRAPAPASGTIDYYRYLTDYVIAGTRGARFTAARLLQLKERASLLIQSVLAVLLVWVSVILLAYPNTDPAVTRQLAIVSVTSSVAILAITLFEYALGRGLLAAKLHDSSLRATAIMRKLERELVRTQPSLATLEAAAEDYEQENILTNVNHSTLDFIIWKYSRAKSKWAIINLCYRVRSFVAQTLVVAFAVSPGLITLVVIISQAWELPFFGIR